MDGSLKQRLVGAIVLVAVGVIVVPVLLDNQREDNDIATQIPLEPSAEDVREIPLNLEEAHRKVVEEQQALVANSAPPSAEPAPTEPAQTEPVQRDPAESEDLPSAAGQAASGPRDVTSPDPARVVHSPQTETQTAEPQAKPEPAQANPVEPSKPVEIAAVSPPKPEPGNDAIGAFLDSAWVVQAGVFGNDANARSLADKLKTRGLKAFTRKTAQGTRVFVGPELDRSKAQAMLPQVQAITTVKPMVVAFDPQQH